MSGMYFILFFSFLFTAIIVQTIETPYRLKLLISNISLNLIISIAANKSNGAITPTIADVKLNIFFFISISILNSFDNGGGSPTS
ncbi:hypothetical protein PSKAS_12710 [Peribacillus sp. N1]